MAPRGPRFLEARSPLGSMKALDANSDVWVVLPFVSSYQGSVYSRSGSFSSAESLASSSLYFTGEAESKQVKKSINESVTDGDEGHSLYKQCQDRKSQDGIRGQEETML